MANFKEESHIQNITKDSKCIDYAINNQTPIEATTLQRKVTTKTEICLEPRQLHETKWLFRQYELPKPGWLRQRFLLNQRRRKCLNDVLSEAQLDGSFCSDCHNLDDWSGLLHSLWHKVNQEKICI